MSRIELHGIKKSYQVSRQILPVLQGIDLELEKEQITVMIGRSGCGKTTLLRVIASLETYDSGTVRIPAGEKVGMVFQEARLMPWLDVERNIAFSDTERKLKPERIAQLVDLTGLRGFERAKPAQLSGGMQQRVALARALAYDPDWLLMDEPFSSLDYFTRAAMQRELLQIQKAERKGILFVTHSIDEALTLADHILLLQNGQISHKHDLRGLGPVRDLLAPELIKEKKEILQELENIES